MAQHDRGRAELGRNDYISLWHLPTFLITPILNHGNGRPESLSSPLLCSQGEAACFFMDLVEVPLPGDEDTQTQLGCVRCQRITQPNIQVTPRRVFLQVSDRIAVTPSTGRGAIHQGNPATEWAQSDKGATEQGAERTR